MKDVEGGERERAGQEIGEPEVVGGARQLILIMLLCNMRSSGKEDRGHAWEALWEGDMGIAERMEAALGRACCPSRALSCHRIAAPSS